MNGALFVGDAWLILDLPKKKKMKKEKKIQKKKIFFGLYEINRYDFIHFVKNL